MTTQEPTGPKPPDRKTISTALVSNSASIPPTSDHQAVPRNLHEILGIDYLSLSFPVGTPGPELDHADRWDFHNERSVRVIRNLTFEAKGITVTLKVSPALDGWRASMVFNPSEFMGNPDPQGALPLTELPAALTAMWMAMQEFVVPKVAMADATVNRIDVARDFEVEVAAMVTLLETLHRIKVVYATSRPLFTSTSGIPETLYAGTKKQGCVRLYNRHAKDPTVPPGIFRVEVEARRKWAKRYGAIETVADISSSTIVDLFMDRFEWAGAGQPVTYEKARLQRLWDITQNPNPIISAIQATRFVGVESFRAAGIVVDEGNSMASIRNALRAALGAAHDSLAAPLRFCLHPAYDQPVQIPG